MSIYKNSRGYVLHSEIREKLSKNPEISPRQTSGVCGSLAKKGWIYGFGNWEDMEVTCMAKVFYKIKLDGCNHAKCFCKRI